MPTIRPLRLSGTSDLQPRIVSCSGNWDGSSKLFRRPNNNPPAALSNVGVFGKPQAAQPSASTHHVSQTSVTERHRSNSESTVQGNRNKRLGMPPPPRTAANSTFLLENFTLIEPYKHHRGYSHDSVIDMNSPTTRSPNDSERRPGQYFRRLSSLPEHKRTSLSSARVGEAARGILYALSTLQKPIEQCVHSTKNTQGPHKKAERALYNGNFHIGSLVSALTSYEERDDELAVQKVIDACFSCVATFGQIMAMLQPSVKEVGFVSTSPDGRYIRTLILMIFGAYIEIRNSYSILRPSLVTNSTTENGNVVDTGVSTSAMDSSRHGQHPASSISALDANVSAAVTIPAFLATLRSTGSSFPGQVSPGTLQSISASHSDSGLDQEGALYQKFLIATSAALSNLPQVDREIKASGPQGLQPHITLKLREVTTLCISGTEVARRLSKLRWEAVQDGDISERKKFWDETIKFTNVTCPTKSVRVTDSGLAVDYRRRRTHQISKSRICLFKECSQRSRNRSPPNQRSIYTRQRICFEARCRYSTFPRHFVAPGIWIPDTCSTTNACNTTFRGPGTCCTSYFAARRSILGWLVTSRRLQWTK